MTLFRKFSNATIIVSLPASFTGVAVATVGQLTGDYSLVELGRELQENLSTYATGVLYASLAFRGVYEFDKRNRQPDRSHNGNWIAINFISLNSLRFLREDT